jgi:hypothetical protein
VLEHAGDVSPGHARGRRGEVRHVHFIDQMAEKSHLGEQLDVQELRARLKRYGRELGEPVELARRMDVGHRHREDRPPEEAGKPAPDRASPADGSAAEDVVAMVDRLEERIEVPRAPGRDGVRDQHERSRRPQESPLHRLGEAAFIHHNHHDLGAPAASQQQIADRASHERGSNRIAVRDHDDADGRIVQGVALKVSLERIKAVVVGRGHPASGGALQASGAR